jgi:Putative transposase
LRLAAYLANYTHRIAISNSRIVSFDGERVSPRYRDYACGNDGNALCDVFFFGPLDDRSHRSGPLRAIALLYLRHTGHFEDQLTCAA